MVKEELNQDSSQSENLQSAEAQPDAQTASQTALSEAENEQITKLKSEGSDKQTEQEEAASAFAQTETNKKGKQKKEKHPRTKQEKMALFKDWMFTAILPVIISGIIRAFAIYIFVSPNNFAPGGVTGTAVLLEYVTKLSSGIFLAILNVPLFFIAFFWIGKKEAFTSTISMLLTSGLLVLFDLLKMQNIQYTGDGGNEPLFHGLLGAVAGGVFLGIALAIMLRGCGTSGGTTIIASLINKKFKNLSVSMLTGVFDAVVVFISIFVYDVGDTIAAKLNPVLLALVSLIVTSKVCDVILQGFKTAYKFEIITSHPEELSEEIMRRTHHGVTRVEAEGMYSHENKSMLVCIIRKRQMAELQRIIRSYPGTFAYFIPTSEVYGKFLK